MQFPFRFSCELGCKRDQPESCRCIIHPLTISLQTDTLKRQFKLLELRHRDGAQKNTIVLVANQQHLSLRFHNNVDYRVCHSAMEALIPDGEFGEQWRKEEPLEVLSTESCEVFTTEHKRKGVRMMLRKLKIVKLGSSNELQFIRLINNRCVLKPECVYVESGIVKLLYKPFNGILLKRYLKKKRLPQEDELRQFATKVMFFLSELESRKLRMAGFKEDLVLLQSQKYSLPQVLDLSSVQIQDPCSGGNRHIWSIGVMLYKIVMGKSPETSQLSRIKRWLAGDAQAFHETQTIYNKSFFELLLEMLSDNGSRTNLEKLLKHRWFLEKFDTSQKGTRLNTIKSLTYQDSEQLSEREQDFSDNEVEMSKEQTSKPQAFPGKPHSSQYIQPNHEWGQGELTLESRMSQLRDRMQTPFHFLFQLRSPPRKNEIR